MPMQRRGVKLRQHKHLIDGNVCSCLWVYQSDGFPSEGRPAWSGNGSGNSRFPVSAQNESYNVFHTASSSHNLSRKILFDYWVNMVITRTNSIYKAFYPAPEASSHLIDVIAKINLPPSPTHAVQYSKKTGRDPSPICRFRPLLIRFLRDSCPQSLKMRCAKAH